MNGNSRLRGFGRCRLDLDHKVLWADGEPVELPLKAVELLCVLVERPGAVVSKEEIWHQVWNDAFVEETNLTHYVYRLRKAFKDLGEGNLIKTVPRRGYRFVREVLEIPDSEMVIEKYSTTQTMIEFAERNRFDILTAVRGLIGARSLIAVSAIVMTLLILGVGSWRYGGFSSSASAKVVRSLAVLPLKELDDQAHNDHLGFGIADLLTTRLNYLNNIEVRPTSSAGEFESYSTDPTTLAKKLKVDALLQGTVSRSDARVRVNMQLIRSGDGKPLWTGEFERNTDDELKFESEISTQIVNALSLDLNDRERSVMAKYYTDDPDAYRLYVDGRAEWNERSWAGMVEAERLFRSAIAKDPKFALAYVGLADRLITESDPTEASAVIDKALELDPNLAEAYASRGFLETFHYWKWDEAETSFKRSIELNPNYAPAHQWYAILLEIRGRNSDAIIEMKRAVEIDPLSPNYLADLGQAYYFARDYNSASAYCRQALKLNPEFHFADDYLRDISLKTGDLDTAAKEILRSAELSPRPVVSDRQREKNRIAADRAREEFARLGGANYLRRLTDEYPDDPVGAFFNAKIYAAFGDTERAVNALERSVNGRTFGVVFIKTDPLYDGLHQDPRYQTLLNRMNLSN